MLILNVGKGPEGYGSYSGTGIPGATEISIDLLSSCSPDVACDVLCLPFRDEQFDRVIASHVLEHIDPYEVQYAFLEMKRILRRGGHLHIRVPDMDWACEEFLSNKDSLFQQGKIFGSKQSGYHRMGFNAGLLVAHVQLAGLEGEGVAYDWAAVVTEYEDGRVEQSGFKEIRLNARRK